MLDRLLGLGGVAVVLGSAVWASAGGPTAPVVTVVVIGVVLTGADALVWRAADSAEGASRHDLAVPEGRRIAGPPWGALVAAALLLGFVAAVLTGAPALAVGSVCLLAATLAGAIRPVRQEQLAPRIVSAARRLRRFARRHGTGQAEHVDGYVTTVGESGARLVVVAPDGSWADLMLTGDDAAVVAVLARVALRDPTDAAAGRGLRTGRQEWARMARSW
ncbi:MAG: hypothetical protein ACRDWI_05735 [Jiangellaceae bacterium]